MFANEKVIQERKECYSEGTRIKVIVKDESPDLPMGTLGTIQFVDDLGQIHVNWDNGSDLVLAYGEDIFTVVN